jgi:hypothetical protein
MNHISFTILSVNVDADSVVVRPQSDLFQNNPESYAPFNINLTGLDKNQDILTQIASYTLPIVNSILVQESDKTSYLNVLSGLNSNSTYTVPISDISNLIPYIPETPLVQPSYISAPIVQSSFPISSIQETVDTIVTYKVDSTYSSMLSSTLLEGIEFIV